MITRCLGDGTFSVMTRFNQNFPLNCHTGPNQEAAAGSVVFASEAASSSCDSAAGD